MTSGATDWIAPTGVRRFDPEATTTAIPASAMADPRLSLTAKGLYTLLITYQGEPIDPYADAIEDVEDIRAAIDELINCGYAVRVAR
jgi:hypothetical protein